MMRSLYSGVSGLKTHQIKMDVIGNNIANVNTVGYKSQSITFSELMYQTTQKASGPNAVTGTAGVNAKQIGLGVATGAISTAITTQGATQTTGNAFDLKITGDAFFVVNDGTSNFFTRDGSFYVDAVGNLAMSSTGYNVMGWLPRVDEKTGATTIVQDQVKKLQILSDDNMVSPPKATTKATITGILDKNDTNVNSSAGKTVTLSFYDNLGYSYTARFAVKGTDDEGKYVMALEDVLDVNNESVLDKFDATIYTGNDSAGKPSYANKAAKYKLAEGYTVVNGTTNTADSLKLKNTKGETLDPTDFLTTAGKVDKTNADKLKAATEYAEAFGYDDPEKFFNLTVADFNGTTNEYKTIGSLMKAGTNNYKKEPVPPATTSTDMRFIAEDGTLSVDGYAQEAGTGITITYDQATGKFTGINGQTSNQAFNLFLQPKEEGADNPFEVVSIDMSTSINYNNQENSTISGKSGDSNGDGTGWAIGTMTGVSIQNNGMIYGAYDNGQTKLLGQIASAKFANAAGLEKQGDNLYAATLNSGEFDGIGVDITSDGGYMSTGVIEMSNVDLSSEFTELITTQRGFQANSRIITVSDTLLEELVNLKR